MLQFYFPRPGLLSVHSQHIDETVQKHDVILPMVASAFFFLSSSFMGVSMQTYHFWTWRFELATMAHDH